MEMSMDTKIRHMLRNLKGKTRLVNGVKVEFIGSKNIEIKTERRIGGGTYLKVGLEFGVYTTEGEEYTPKSIEVSRAYTSSEAQDNDVMYKQIAKLVYDTMGEVVLQITPKDLGISQESINSVNNMFDIGEG